MKKAEMAWCYLWEYLFIAWELLKRCGKRLDLFGEWMEHQVDHNNYLAGFIGAVYLITIPWLIGIIDIIVRG